MTEVLVDSNQPWIEAVHTLRVSELDKINFKTTKGYLPFQTIIANKTHVKPLFSLPHPGASV